ncbi:lasso peptide biosynthesis PqqD family chaperone [Streptomyces harbinensis]
MKPVLAPHVYATATDHGLVLLDERSGRYWQLNGTGAAVVRLLEEGKTPGEAAAALQRRYPDRADRVSSDVDQLLSALRRAGLVIA